MKIPDINDICGGFQMPIVAVKTTLFFIILLNVKADVQQPPVPPTATRPSVDKFMKREHSLIKPFQGKLNLVLQCYGSLRGLLPIKCSGDPSPLDFNKRGNF